MRALEEVVSNYAEVMKKNPDNVDAAYNYEYAVRKRDAAMRARETPRAKSVAAAEAETSPADSQAEATGDLPAGPTIHGRPGAPPSDADMQKFKVLAPMRPDERQGNPDKAGANKRPLRGG